MSLGPVPESIARSLTGGTKSTVPLRRRMRRHANREVVVDVDHLEDQPIFSRAELSGSGFDALFEELDRVRAPGGWIMLSTPHPGFARWVSENRPELMQVVDEPVELSELVQLAAGFDLEPVAYRAYSVDAPTARQYQFVVLAPMAARARQLYRPLRGHWLRARLASSSNPVAPAARRTRQAFRLLRAGRPKAAAWLLHLRRQPPL